MSGSHSEGLSAGSVTGLKGADQVEGTPDGPNILQQTLLGSSRQCSKDTPTKKEVRLVFTRLPLNTAV